MRQYTILETNQLCGRIIAVAGKPYTVLSASTEGDVAVWDPETHTRFTFDSRATFENWMYGTPVSAADRPGTGPT